MNVKQNSMVPALKKHSVLRRGQMRVTNHSNLARNLLGLALKVLCPRKPFSSRQMGQIIGQPQIGINQITQMYNYKL